MIDNLLKEYAEQFGEAFPVFAFPDDEEKIINTIKECLEKGKAYIPEYEKDILY